MSALDEIAEKLPDVYFDWYARLLPGVAGVIAFAVKGTAEQRAYVSEHVAITVFIGYLVGHFIQPAGSFIAKQLEKSENVEEAFSAYKGRSDKIPELIAKASKAHAEAVSMASGSLVASCLVIYYGITSCVWDSWLIAAALVLFLFTIERVKARSRKVRDFPPAENAKK